MEATTISARRPVPLSRRTTRVPRAAQWPDQLDRPSGWILRVAHRGSRCRPHATCCLRPCGIKMAQSRVGSTQTPDQQPCQWVLTPLPPCYPPSSHSRRASSASMDASRSFLFHLLARGESMLARRRTRAGHVVDRGRPGSDRGFWFLWSTPLIDRITRHLAPSPLDSCCLGGQ